MSAPARTSQWARELLVGRAVWQPLGVLLSLWAWFGWLAVWFAALLPERSGLRGPSAAIFILAAALLGHASAALANRLSLPGVTAASGRLLLLMALLATAWWTHAGARTPLSGDGGARWQAVWIIVLGLGYAWARAGRLSPGEALEPESCLRRLFTGTLFTAAAVILFPQATRAVGEAFLPIYVGGGLTGVALGQVHDASRRRGGRPLPYGLSWHAGLVLGVASVALLGAGAGLLLAADPAWSLAEATARVVAAIGRGLGSILAPIVEAILRLAGPLFDAIVRMLQSWMEGAQQTEIAVPQPIAPPGGEIGAGEAANDLLARLGAVLRLLVTIVGAALFLWLAIRTARRVRKTPEDGEVEVVEASIPGERKGREGGWRSALRSAVRLRERARRLYHALLVRRVYAQLLEWAAGAGRPRRSAETPLEFGVALAALWPGLRRDLDLITGAYLDVRYGEAPEQADTVNRVLASWDRIRHSTAPNRRIEQGNSR